MDERAQMACLTRAVDGDADALQALIISHHKVLLAKVVAELGSVMTRHVDAEDILQEAYARAFRSVADCRFDHPRAFCAWLEGIALNTLRDQHRFLMRKKRDVHRNLPGSPRTSESMGQLFERVAVTDSTPSRALARAEASAAVISSLARLTEDQRKVVRLRFLEGWAVVDLAVHMDKSESAIHMLCHRGLKALRETMLSMSRYFPSR